MTFQENMTIQGELLVSLGEFQTSFSVIYFTSRYVDCISVLAGVKERFALHS